MKRIKRQIRALSSTIPIQLRTSVLGRQRKVFLLTSPPRQLRNLGDHAQTLGIKLWIKAHLPNHDIYEFDKTQVLRHMAHISRHISKDDIILLQSGGNLGDTGIWSERARREVISALPLNKVFILPQTIWFRKSSTGQAELQTTRHIYNAHKQLTIVARDPVSLSLANQYFPSCRRLLAPDFALYLLKASVVQDISKQESNKGKTLVILRSDEESIHDTLKKDEFVSILRQSRDINLYDTVLNKDIPRRLRWRYVYQALETIAQHDAVVTDRFHGLVFSILARRPCIVLPNLSHKVNASRYWFNDIPYIHYASDMCEAIEIGNDVDRGTHLPDTRRLVSTLDALGNDIFGTNS